MEAALRAGRLDDAATPFAYLGDRPRGLLPPYLLAEVDHFAALLAAAGGNAAAVEEHFPAAEQVLRALGYPYFLARVLGDHGTGFATRAGPTGPSR